MPSKSAMRVFELGAIPARPQLDVEARRLEQFDSGLADLLGHQDFHAAAATIQSMHAVSASTSDGSTAGNIPTRN